MSFALLALALMLPSQQTTRTLASLVDVNRVLLVFAPADTDPRFQQQLAIARRHAAEMKDRDLILVANVVNAGPPADADTLRILPGSYTFDANQLATRSRFHVAPGDFTVILLGKDGDEKLRSHAPISIERLNLIIDAMPMRRQEMRERKPGTLSPDANTTSKISPDHL